MPPCRQIASELFSGRTAGFMGTMAAMVVRTELAMSRLGSPQSTVERGTIEKDSFFYTCRWSWPCGCSGEIIAGSLIELRSCPAHEPQ
jgi:hypothetical protein